MNASCGTPHSQTRHALRRGVYKILDYIDFLESNMRPRDRRPEPAEAVAEGVEDTLRAGRMAAGVRRHDECENKAVGVLTDVANAGSSCNGDRRVATR